MRSKLAIYKRQQWNVAKAGWKFFAPSTTLPWAWQLRLSWTNTFFLWRGAAERFSKAAGPLKARSSSLFLHTIPIKCRQLTSSDSVKIVCRSQTFNSLVLVSFIQASKNALRSGDSIPPRPTLNISHCAWYSFSDGQLAINKPHFPSTVAAAWISQMEINPPGMSLLILNREITRGSVLWDVTPLWKSM